MGGRLNFLTRLRTLVRSDEGQDLLEYALLVTLIALGPSGPWRWRAQTSASSSRMPRRRFRPEPSRDDSAPGCLFALGPSVPREFRGSESYHVLLRVDSVVERSTQEFQQIRGESALSISILGLSESGSRARLCLRTRRPTISPPRVSGLRMKDRTTSRPAPAGALHGLRAGSPAVSSSECSVVVVSSIEEEVEKAGEALHGRHRRSNWLVHYRSREKSVVLSDRRNARLGDGAKWTTGIANLGGYMSNSESSLSQPS